jgi:polynucleotide 5'-triphosphatase
MTSPEGRSQSSSPPKKRPNTTSEPDPQPDSTMLITPAPNHLPPLSLSILGIEPLDEFIKDVADFVHHMINTRPDVNGQIEVEAKIGVLKDNISGNRLALPVRVETSMSRTIF